MSLFGPLRHTALPHPGGSGVEDINATSPIRAVATPGSLSWQQGWGGAAVRSSERPAPCLLMGNTTEPLHQPPTHHHSLEAFAVGLHKVPAAKGSVTRDGPAPPPLQPITDTGGRET